MMNEHPYRKPSALSRWQRFLYFFFAKLGLTTWDIEQSRWFWYRLGVDEGKKHHPPGVGPCCQVHGTGSMICAKCRTPAPLMRFPDYEPHTDPHVIPARHYVNLRERGAGPRTAALEAIPKWLVRLRQVPKEEK